MGKFMEHIKEGFKSVWGMLGVNTATLATVQLADIEIVLKIILLLITIISTILITVHKLKKK